MNVKRASLLVILITLIAFLGCQTPAGRSPGQVVDDSTIGPKVKAKLFDDPQLSGLAIDVQVFQGEVTLTGAVKSQAEKQRATEIANSVQGVKKVNNLLSLKK